jgi:hypothetical protein
MADGTPLLVVRVPVPQGTLLPPVVIAPVVTTATSGYGPFIIYEPHSVERDSLEIS